MEKRAPNLIPFNKWPELHNWPTLAGLRHLRFYCETNGFKAAFVKVGRRVLIDEEKFFDAVRGLNIEGGKND